MLKNIAIIMGGYSSEYQISLKSGSMVYDTLDRYKYTPYAIHILKHNILVKFVLCKCINNFIPWTKIDLLIISVYKKTKSINYKLLFLVVL